MTLNLVMLALAVISAASADVRALGGDSGKDGDQSASDHWHHHHKHHAAPAPASAASPASGEQAAAHAREAAGVAKQAAKVANKVAKHSMKVTHHAKKALKHALGALHDARVETEGLDHEQKTSLKKAEAHLREATKTADYGELKKLKTEKDEEKEKMQKDLDKMPLTENVDKLEKEDQLDKGSLKYTLPAEEEKKDDKEEGEKKDEEKDGKGEDKKAKKDGKDGEESNDDEEAKEGKGKNSKEGEEKNSKGKNLKDGTAEGEPTPIEDKGIDIDTQMPYGDLEPFGREDTAQELTESSVKESDEMVDQLERAEVAEEKRSVFRALTRLRGAAITSYDGVARAQTGNIDQFGKTHKWRKAHPLHHLADEESDISKWAFPDNADFLQKTKKGVPTKQ